MAAASKIEWTDATWNPVTGCSVVSPGCTNCYAMQLAGTRLRTHPSRKGLTREVNGNHVWTGEVRLNAQWLEQPLSWKRPRMVFVCAHGDLFHEDVPDGWIAYVWSIMMQCPQHTFQVLTKRADRMRAWVAKWNDLTGDDDPMEFKNARGPYAVRRAHPSGRGQLFADYLDVMLKLAGGKIPDGAAWPTFDWMHGWKYWPGVAPNIWLGVSAEDQRRACERIPALLATPAAVRFVSAEPLLGPIRMTHLISNGPPTEIDALTGISSVRSGHERISTSQGASLDWVIVGGESGQDARPMHPAWARSMRDQCQTAGVPFFFKQWGAWEPYRHPDDGTIAPHVLASNGALSSGDRLEGCPARERPPWVPVRNVGKARAGRLLDGIEWNEMPGSKQTSEVA